MVGVPLPTRPREAVSSSYHAIGPKRNMPGALELMIDDL